MCHIICGMFLTNLLADPPMLKFLAIFLSGLVLLYLGACGYLYVNQRAYLYFPTPQVEAHDAQNLTLVSDGERLRIWRIGQAKPDALIYFGGNAQDVAGNIPAFAQTFPQHTVYLVNYRGYGGSTGTPSEAGLFKDALAIYDFVRQRHARIAVMGQSLGSGVAVFLASARDIAKLVLLTPYDSIENLAKRNFPQFPVSLILKDKFASVQRAGSIAVPTLILLAEHDEIIPRENSQALAAAFRRARPMVEVIPGTTHGSICGNATCLRRLGEFLER